MPAQQEETTLSIVLLGAFNPAIFHPAWFGQVGLLGKAEAEAATVEMTHPELSVFHSTWFRVEVTRDRYTLSTNQQSHYPLLRDLAGGSLGVLGHTPVRAVGINHAEVVRLHDRKAFDQLGWRLVPPDPWEGILERPGMAALVEQGLRDDGFDGFVRVKVEPMLDDSMRVLIEVNDHVFLSMVDGTDRAPVAASESVLNELFFDRWPEIDERAESIFDRVREWLQ